MDEKELEIKIYMKCSKCNQIVESPQIEGWQKFPTICKKCDWPFMLELKRKEEKDG